MQEHARKCKQIPDVALTSPRPQPLASQTPAAQPHSPPVPAPQPKNIYTESERIKKREKWKNNKRAGLFYKEIEKPYIDKKGSFTWLQNGILTYNEERLIIAAQDQGIMTNGLKKSVQINK